MRLTKFRLASTLIMGSPVLYSCLLWSSRLWGDACLSSNPSAMFCEAYRVTILATPHLPLLSIFVFALCPSMWACAYCN